MRDFIHRENIRHFQSLLGTTTDENKRLIILKLLAEEEGKEATATPSHDPPNEGVSHLNLEYYRKRLATETSTVTQGILTRLIAEEEARLASLYMSSSNRQIQILVSPPPRSSGSNAR